MNIFKITSPTATNISLKKAVAMLLFMAFTCFAFGQTALKYVPSTADVVVTLNLQNIDKKVNLAQLQQYDFYQAMLKEMNKTPELEGDSSKQEYVGKLFTDPASLGFDTKEPSCFFVEKVGFDTYLTFVMKMGDKKRYEATVQNFKKDNYLPNLTEGEGMKIWQKGKELFAWNDEVVVNVLREKGYDPNSYDWGYTPDAEAGTEVEDGNFTFDENIYEEDQAPGEYVIQEDYSAEELDSIIKFSAENGDTIRITMDDGGEDFNWEEQAQDSFTFENNDFNFDWMEEQDTAAVAWAQKVLNRQFLQPITRNERFMAAKGRTDDLHVWMDYGFFTESMRSAQAANMGMAVTNSYAQMMSAMGGMMDVFYGDTYLSMGLNFEDGRMALRSQLFFNEDMKRFYSRALDAKFNKKFLRYVKGGDEMFGYFYLNYNIKNTIEESKTLLYKIFAATPQYGEAAADAMKILGIFIDEDAVGNLLKGDMMVAVSGIQTVESTIQTYDYDADFNFTTRDTTVMKQVPIFTALASYGNGKDIQKFIDLGLHSKVLTPESNYYRLDVPGMDGMTFFLAKHDGLLIFTNNAYLMRQNLEKGFDKKLRLPKNHKKRLCKSSSVAYWNIPNTMKSVMGSEADSNIGMMGYLNNIGKEFYSMEVTSSKKVGNSVDSEMFLNMTKKDTNALQQFFNFINDLYLETIGGAKI